MLLRAFGFSLVAALVMQASVHAHYLWVVVDTVGDGQPVVNFIFEESPRIGDGHYLDPFVKDSKTWLRTVESPKPDPLKLQEKIEKTASGETKRRWLSTDLQQAAPRAVDSAGTFGVYRYGKTDVLLHYYAKYLEVTGHEDLHELARAEHQQLDIVPHDNPDGMTMTVYWKGERAAGLPLYVRGPKGFRETLKTDDKGRASFPVKEAGRYTMRTYVELPDSAGTHEGKAYQKVRHHATLTMPLPLE